MLLALLIVELVGAAFLTRHLIHHLTRIEGIPPELRGLSFWETFQIMHPQERLLLYRLNTALVQAGAAALLLSGLASFWLARYLTRPLAEMRAVAMDMAGGDFGRRVPEDNADELGDLARALNSLAASLEEAERLRRQMTADIAHELRTPLAGLRSYVEALRDGVLPADAANLEAVLAETLRLERLVEDLRELSLLEAGGIALDLGPVDAGEVIQRVLALQEAAAGRLGVSLLAEVPGALPPAQADADRLAQVLHNLVANALSHTPRGGRVTVSAEQADGFLCITVADTGPGIPPEALPYVFERFYRADPSRERTKGGSGLGLTIARALVEGMGGRIRAESEPGRGARLSFTVPAWAGRGRRPGAAGQRPGAARTKRQGRTPTTSPGS